MNDGIKKGYCLNCGMAPHDGICEPKLAKMMPIIDVSAVGAEREQERCCDASPHDTKVMRKIRRWMNEHHPTDCDVDEAEWVIGLLEENKGLRKLIWLRHGCSITSLYGDDGEMQCGTCGIDFKRSPVTAIIKRFEAIAIKALEEAKNETIEGG